MRLQIRLVCRHSVLHPLLCPQCSQLGDSFVVIFFGPVLRLTRSLLSLCDRGRLEHDIRGPRGEGERKTISDKEEECAIEELKEQRSEEEPNGTI